MNENNLVTKANTLITAHYNTTLEELRIVRTLISLVQPHDEDFKPYVFHIAEFMDLLGVKDKSKYTEIPKITENLMKKIIKIREGKTLLQVAWLSSAKYEEGTGTVTLSFDPHLKPYLLGLKELFTTYKLENVLILNSKYSIRLYEILKSNEYKKTITISLLELSEIFKLSKAYSEYQNIKNRIIEPAKKELAEKTDITFDYETITKRKKVIALKFTIKTNHKKTIIEPPPTLALSESTSGETSKDSIQEVKDEFKRLYNAELVDRFVKEMIDTKGLEQVKACVKDFQQYIKGKQIKNMGGCFKSFVMNDYVKPVSYDGITRLHPIYETPPEERERQEKIARGEDVKPTATPEVVRENLNKMREVLGIRTKRDSL